MKKLITQLGIRSLLVLFVFAKVSMAVGNTVPANYDYDYGEKYDYAERYDYGKSYDYGERYDYGAGKLSYLTLTDEPVRPVDLKMKICLTPIILVPPVNVSACLASVAVLSVVALNATGYQWQVNTGSGYMDIVDGPDYSGANTASLSLLNVSANITGYTYRVIVYGDCSLSATSGGVSLSLLSPYITESPTSSTICAGANTQFNSAAGLASSYQWQVDQGSGYANVSNGGVYSGATTTTLSITGATASMNGYKYRNVATGLCNPVAVTTAATLTVNTPPAITQDPAASTICEGANTGFTVTATGSALTYQWQVNQGAGFANVSDGGVYSGATTATLSITGGTASMNGYTYRSVITGVCSPTTTSTPASLTVNTLPAITLNPSASTICDGANTGFTASATGTGVTYQWQVDQGSGFANISNGGVYSGATTSSLSITGATASMNGYSYRNVASGTCSPAATSTAAALTVNTLPAITLNPAASTICDGANTTFSVTATGTGLTYQWQVDQGAGFANVSNGGVYSGATTATLTITGATVAMNGYSYRNVATGTCSPAATSSAAVLTINTSPAVMLNPVASTICAGSNTSFTVAATGSGVTYQWQVDEGAGFANVSNGGVYSGATTATLSITGATVAMNAYKYRSVASGSCSPAATSTAATLTINTLPAVTQNPAASTICAGSNTTFTVVATGTGVGYQWQVDQGAGFANVSNGGVYSGATTATLTITGATVAMNAYKYRSVATGTCSPAATSTAATLTINTLPAITQNPAASTICTGGNTTFTVVATGTGVGYQWQVDQGAGFANVSNGGVYSGATTATLSITGATAAMNAYKYRNVASGTCSPAATSSAATLTVNTLPALTQNPAASSICAGSNTTFTVVATGTGLTYQWQVDQGAGFANVSNGGAYSGATTATLSITGATVAMNAYKYRNVVTGTCSPAATSTAATLTVLANVTYYADADNDGYGNPAVSIVSCTGAPAGYVTNSGDSNDSDPAINPGATEICGDGIDNNSNGSIDEGCTSKILANQCGITLASLGTGIYAQQLPGVTQYRFRVTNGANVQTIDKTTPQFAMSQLSSSAYNTTYAVDVAVNFGSGFGPYGASCNLTTPYAMTQVQAAQCGTTLAAINTDIFANNINGATMYRFRITNGASVQTIDRTSRSFNLTQLASYNYGVTYAIDVKVEASGFWGPYGTSCNVTTPVLSTKIQAAQCGTELPALNTQVYADLISGATAYRFRVTNGAIVQVIENPTRVLNPSQISGNGYNITYGIEVAVLFNGTWSSYGASCNIIMPKAVTKIQTAQCGTTLPLINTSIFADEVTEATSYRFRITEGANVQTIDKTARSFSLTQLASYAYLTTYSIDVAVQVNGLYGPYGAACNVTTGPLVTKIQDAQCGTVLPAIGSLIYADNVPAATQYRFRVTNGASVQTIDRTTRSFTLTQLASYEYGTTYSIDVAWMSSGSFSTYGPACNVTSPTATTKLQPANCDATIAPTATIFALLFTGATQYRFRFTLGASIITVDRSVRNLPLGTVSGLTPNTTYVVDVAVFYNGIWQTYGAPCNLTLSSGSARPEGESTTGQSGVLAGAFDAVVYPNPFAGEFGISVTTASTEDVKVSVYDLTGKLISGQTVAAQEMNSLRIGSDYAAGIYQVIVTQGTDVKILKVAKQ